MRTTGNQLVVQCNKAIAMRTSNIASRKRRASYSTSIAPNSCRAMRKPLQHSDICNRHSVKSDFSKTRLLQCFPWALVRQRATGSLTKWRFDMQHVYNDGGRAASGFKGPAGDCVARAISIAAQRPYSQTYFELATINSKMRKTKRRKSRSVGRRTAAHGIYVRSKLFKDYMQKLGFRWVPTMQIGSGCKVHLADGELPNGRLVVSVSKHYTAVIDGVIHDTYDPQREVHCVKPDHGGDLKMGEWRNENGICSVERRCVYGYWMKD